MLKNKIDKNGFRQGYWEKYFNGRLDYTDNYIDGKLNGLTVNYHSNGNILNRGYFLNNVVVGYWEYQYGDKDMHKKEFIIN